MALNVCSQEIYQQTNIELGEVLNESESYLCQATTSIKLLPGFMYRPNKTKSLSLEIDRYSVFPPDDGYYGGVANDDDGVVGALPASFCVSNTGAAVYAIELKLPNAIGTMIPKLSFVYNSQSANGILGWSWDLSGLSSVERVGQSIYHDGKITYVDFENDRFVIDGQRLMLVDGVYGANGAEYKTEVDNFDKVISYAKNDKCPERFVVWKNDGTIWEYGATDDSRIEAQHDDIVLKWMLCKISDRNGNSIVFNYDEVPSDGVSYIDNIEYTLNEKKRVRPEYRIQFVYETKTSDMPESYVYGNVQTSKRILKNVFVINNSTGKRLYDYSLEYYKPGFYGRNYFIHYRLKSVGLSIGEDKINPTEIIWNSEKHYPVDDVDFQLYQQDKSIFSNVPFVGDFNGDGLSDVLMVPYKIQNAYPDDVVGEVYINDGNGGFHVKPAMTVLLPKNLEWVYVLDLNGDAVDDIVTYEINYDAQSQSDIIAKTQFYIVEKGNLVNLRTCSWKKNVVLVPGNFIHHDRSDVLILDAYDGKRKDKLASCYYYSEGAIRNNDIKESDDVNGADANFMSLDVTGDGVSELFVLKKDGYDIYDINGNFTIRRIAQGTSLTSEVYVFPNDYNGDGKTDILYYDSSRCWRMVFSDGRNFTDSKLCSSVGLLKSLNLNQKDRYRYSLRELERPSVTIRTADFDGDGCADVGVFKNMAGNYYFNVGLSPYVKSDNTIAFACEKRYFMPINYSHQTIHLGRFLAQENVSILSGLPRKPLNSQHAYITSLYPHSSYYSVERIVDGMGNVRGFSYDYLMAKNGDNCDFYSCDNTTINDIRRISVPVAALKTDTTFNVNGKCVVNAYQYNNALVHSKGHGFLGFEKVVTRNYINGNLIQKQLTEYECNTLKSHSMCLPFSRKTYQGEKQIMNEKVYYYDKYCCSNNKKVVVPLVKLIYDIDYNLDKQNEVLKNTITENAYISDIGSDDLYCNLIRQSGSAIGTTDKVSAVYPSDCAYVDETYIEYNDDVDNWVINRPKAIYNFSYDKTYDVVGSSKMFVYDEKYPHRVVKETKIPNVNNDYTDPLTVELSYEYDDVGNVTAKIKSSPSSAYEKIVRYEYGEEYHYRYVTKTIDELGREIDCKYDHDYGLLVSTKDYNDFVTINRGQASGVTSVVELPDGMLKARAFRWSKGNDYAPNGASYYMWEKSTGQAESMVFYHKSGMELRKVTFDIDGDAVFEDVLYDDVGNVKQKTLPYYMNDVKLYVTNVYDKYNRLTETVYPNGVIKRFVYDGNDVVTEMVTLDGKIHSVKEKYNEKDWLVETVDAGGNEIKYEYFCDGLVKSAQIGNNVKTKLSVTYDNCRNRASLYDPNYGLTTYEYDAWGNVVRIRNPKNADIEFRYDVSGRMVARIEKNEDGKSMNSTRWEYNLENGKNGLIDKVISTNGHQIEYIYDDKLRLVKKKEEICGGSYFTTYTYDAANRVSSVTYPSGLRVLKSYSNSGYEKEISNASDNKILWKTNDMNAYGCVVDFDLGDGTNTVVSYDAKTSLVDNIMVANENDVIQDHDYFYDDFGNMLSRVKKNGSFMEEDFEYDNLDRLIGVRLNGVETTKMLYDKQGNIAEKKVGDVDVLYAAVYDAEKPNVILKAKTDDEKLFSGFKQNMKYSSFDNLVNVSSDDDYAEIGYGCDDSRIFMKTQVDGIMKTKIYVDDCEFIEENGRKYVNTFINGPEGVFAVCVIDDKGDKSYNFIHKDNLASWNLITDEDGDVVQMMSFDAWGNCRNYDDWSLGYDGVPLFDRGYTGHEHLWDFGLVNMNGRFYDPMMSMMLSPDNNIQMPHLSQNFNRYSYCLNNPLRYKDPTGECVESVVFGVVGGAVNVLLNADAIDSFGEFGLLFGVGFVKGFLTEYTMGQSWFLQIGIQTLMGGLVSGVNQMVDVGDGTFNFSGDDWNSVKTAAHYGLGSGLVKSFMNAHFTQPTDNYFGDKMMDAYYNEELGHAFTSLAAHGMGCWFSGQPFLRTLSFKDVGFDLKMLGYIANRLLASYVEDCGFAEDALKQRAQEIKDSMMNDILSEDPDFPDFQCTYQLKPTRVNDGRIYVVGHVFALLPGEMLDVYPVPYFAEVVSFPFSYSLFKTLFFYNK